MLSRYFFLALIPATAVTAIVIVASVALSGPLERHIEAAIRDPGNLRFVAKFRHSRARSRWAEKAPASYRAHVRACTPDCREQLVSVHDDGRIEAWQREQQGFVAVEPDQALTVAWVAQRLDAAFESGADTIRARYDSRLAYPAEVFLDSSAERAGDEDRIAVLSLQPL